MTGENLSEFGKIQIHEEDPVAELVLHRQKPAMADAAFVNAAI
jgi:hypothetical protein